MLVLLHEITGFSIKSCGAVFGGNSRTSCCCQNEVQRTISSNIGFHCIVCFFFLITRYGKGVRANGENKRLASPVVKTNKRHLLKRNCKHF